MEHNINKQYWENRYQEKTDTWDLKIVSPPLKAYIDQLTNKQLKILIPGCGYAHEALYLHELGFTNVTVIDIAEQVYLNAKEKLKHTNVNVVLGSIFEHADTYDLILEQTMFCALHPSQRLQYVQTLNKLLQVNGKLVGLLFNKTFAKEGPPFGGHKPDYEPLFAPYFSFNTFEPCYNSFPSRGADGGELFINFNKL